MIAVYPEERNMDGVYGRVLRDGEYKNICFTDMTQEEQVQFTKSWDVENYKRMVFHLSDRLRVIGDTMDLCWE